MESAPRAPGLSQMPIWVINLDRSPERLERMQALLGEAGLAFTRLPAIDGKLLSAEEQQSWLTEAGRRYELTAGEIACFLSHRKCWEAVAAGSASHVAIFEDDIHLGRNAAEILSRTDWIPADADVVKIETVFGPTHIDKEPASTVAGREIARLRHTHLGSGGYVISKGAAAKLLPSSEKLSCNVDEMLFDPRFPIFHCLVVYQMTPALCIQEVIFKSNAPDSALDSIIHLERRLIVRRKRIRGLRKLGREIVRPFKQIGSFLLLRIKGRRRIRVRFE